LDRQSRIYKNLPDRIFWIGCVHEKIIGSATFSALPGLDEYCLIHIKDIKKQELQNEFYSKI
jgi:hypothetical protein